MLRAANYHKLKVSRAADFGLYLDDGEEGVLLPKRFVPEGAKIGDELEVFIYHDSEDRLIATTLQPKAVEGEIVKLKAVSVTPQGAFLDWGLMKDIFLPRQLQVSTIRPNGEYLVKVFIDEQTGRAAVTERFEHALGNENLSVKKGDTVDLVLLRRSDIGYVAAINNKHEGLLHFSDIFQTIAVGDKLKGRIKNITEENKIDLALGEQGYQRIGGEAGKLMKLLEEHNGYLPYHDKSDPEEIYVFFGMSKKAFKMAVGSLYKQQLIELTKTGIKKTDNGQRATGN